MRKRKWLDLILNSVLIVIILFLFLPDTLVVYPFLVGANYSTDNTIGRSMFPVIKPGDTILIKLLAGDKINHIRVGDIICFKEEGSSNLISHRVTDIQIYPWLMFKTKGDANRISDGWIEIGRVKGKIMCIIPSRFFISSGGLIGLMILSVSLMLILMIIKKSSSPNLTIILLAATFMYSLGKLAAYVYIYFSLK